MADDLPRQPYSAAHDSANRGRVARYRQVLKLLRATTAAYNEATDDKTRAECGLSQLRAIVHFFQLDNEVAENFLLRPAHTVLNAVHDRIRGGKPALLEQATESGGWPSDTTRDDAAALLTFCIEILRAANVDTAAAAEWVATETQRLGVTSEDGKSITSRQISTWYAEIKKERASAARMRTFKELELLDVHAPLLNHPDEPDEHQTGEIRWVAEARARALIKTVAQMVPRSAPRRRPDRN
jgi:hypothetical protein